MSGAGTEPVPSMCDDCPYAGTDQCVFDANGTGCTRICELYGKKERELP